MQAELIAEIPSRETFATASRGWLTSVPREIFPSLNEGLRERPVTREKPRPKQDLDAPWGQPNHVLGTLWTFRKNPASGIRIVLTAPQAPRMNAIMERWAGTVRREVLDRMLIISAAHLRKILSEYESHFNGHRPHRALNHASPLRALPDPVDAGIKVIRRDRLGGLLHEYAQVA